MAPTGAWLVVLVGRRDVPEVTGVTIDGTSEDDCERVHMRA